MTPNLLPAGGGGTSRPEGPRAQELGWPISGRVTARRFGNGPYRTLYISLGLDPSKVEQIPVSPYAYLLKDTL